MRTPFPWPQHPSPPSPPPAVGKGPSEEMMMMTRPSKPVHRDAYTYSSNSPSFYIQLNFLFRWCLLHAYVCTCTDAALSISASKRIYTLRKVDTRKSPTVLSCSLVKFNPVADENLVQSADQISWQSKTKGSNFIFHLQNDLGILWWNLNKQTTRRTYLLDPSSCSTAMFYYLAIHHKENIVPWHDTKL